MGCSSSKDAVPAMSAPKTKAPTQEKRKYSERGHAVKETIRGGKGGTRKNFVFVRESVPLDQNYDIIEIIGQGSMGEVTIVSKKHDTLKKVTERHRANTAHSDQSVKDILADVDLPSDESNHDGSSHKERKFACKTINTARFSDAEIYEYLNEIDILRELDHPNIVQLFEVYQMKRKIWIITELCTGGDLTPHMGKLEESEVAIIAEQIVRAVYYMHQRDVCHRDLKLENILFANNKPDAPIKLIDFGLSNKFIRGERMLKACGTVYTAAPEVLLPGAGYTEQTDIWGIGVCTYVLLSGTYPFLKGVDELSDPEKKAKLEFARLEFGPEFDEKGISEEAKDFIRGCIRKNPGSRWIAKRALDFVSNTWLPAIEKREANSKGLSKSVRAVKKRRKVDSATLRGMSKYTEYGEFKKTILMTMAYTMDKSSIEELSEMFMVMDTHGNGTVSLVELKQALKESDVTHMDDKTIEKLFKGIDVDNSGLIHYNEFLAAVVESQGLITMERLADAFDRLDSDGKGYISKDDLKNLLGTDYNEDKVNRMIEEADFKNNGQVDYDEFLRLMFVDPEKGLDTIGTSKFAKDVRMAEKLSALEEGGRINSISVESDTSR